VIIFSLLFFVFLFLKKAIFPALINSLSILLLIKFGETVWQNREVPSVSVFINLVLGAILALAVYALFFLPAEFFVTEIMFIVPRLSPYWPLGILILLSAILSQVNFAGVLEGRWWRRSLVSLLAVSGLVFGIYHHFKLEREYWPKIYSFTPKSGIQAEIVEVKGVNFFPVWKKGKVILGDDEMVINSWDEELIVAEQPVPQKFGPTDLYIVRSEGMISNKVSYEIKDPGKLRN
jgi:hypothetical protein